MARCDRYGNGASTLASAGIAAMNVFLRVRCALFAIQSRVVAAIPTVGPRIPSATRVVVKISQGRIRRAQSKPGRAAIRESASAVPNQSSGSIGAA